MSRSKLRWGDALDDDDALPPMVVKGPDNSGLKTIVDYYRNDKGDAFKKSTKVKVVVVEKKVYKVSDERRNWKRFGQAARETADECVSVQGNEEIMFERVRQHKQTTSEKKATDIQSIMATADKAAISGSLKDILYKKRMERELLRAKGLLKDAEKPPGEDDKGGAPSSLSAPKPGSYVPPSLRNRGAGGGGEGESMQQRRREENSVRVTNLSEDVTEDDLMDLFRNFGAVQRIFLAVDRATGESRGFAFVNFHSREDAERAIKNLNGHGYDNLILKVEWAAPREQK